MESIKSDSDIFIHSNLGLDVKYNNQVLSMIDDSHIHTPSPSNTCGVCNSLSVIVNDDLISAGARQQRNIPKKKPSRSQKDEEDACKPRRNENVSMIPIDEVASTHDWHLRLHKDGDMIAKYLSEHNCDVSKFTIQDMLNVMRKLNIVRLDRNEIFELLGHVKSALSNSSISVKSTHPLVLIHSHAHPKIGEQMRELDKSYSPSNHHALLTTTRFQSVHFVDMSSSQDLLFHYKNDDSTYFIHPILVAMFGVKLPALENTFIYGDSFTLLRQLYEYRRVKPNNYMLLVNRLTEESPIVIAGVTDSISTEVQRANLHTMIRKAIMHIRMGIFYCKDSDFVDTHLMKIIHTGCSQVMTDEEQMLASILSIVGFRPTLVSIARHGTAGNYDMSLQSVPYIVINPMKMITTSDSPISINSSNVYSLTFDGSSGRVVFAPPNIGYRGQFGCGNMDALPIVNGSGIMDRALHSPVIVNGVLMFYIERRQNRNVIGGESYTGFRSIINDTPIEISQDITINGIMYRLKSAVCYKVGDSFFDNCSTDAHDIFLKGHYSIVFTELGPWLYDPLSIFNKASRDARLMRSLKNQYRHEMNSINDDDTGFYEWLKGDGAAFASSKQQMFMNHTSMFEDDLLSIEEAISLISRQCCILIYAQDYQPYIAAKNILDLF